MCFYSATRQNIYIYPYFLFAAIHHLNRAQYPPYNHVAQSAENGGSDSKVVGSISKEVKRFFLYLVWFPDSLN